MIENVGVIIRLQIKPQQIVAHSISSETCNGSPQKESEDAVYGQTCVRQSTVVLYCLQFAELFLKPAFVAFEDLLDQAIGKQYKLT